MRGQIAFEFTTIMAFSVMVLIVFLLTINYSFSNQQELRAQEEADALSALLQQELLIASTVLHGYTRTITLPAALAGQPYTVTVYSDAVHVNTSRYTAIKKVPFVHGQFLQQTTIRSNESGVFLQ